MPNTALLTVLAQALLSGAQDHASTVSRIRQAIGKRGLPGIAKRYLAAFGGKTRPRQRDAEQFLLADPGFARAFPHVPGETQKQTPIRNWLTERQSMLPVLAAREWKLPAITSTGELCEWLRLTPGELEWFADLKGLNSKAATPALHHYYYKPIPKRRGDFRLIEAPKQRLKLLQRQILAEILDPIPHHPAAHGFIHGRSIRTFATAHTGQFVVLRLDLQDFFPSIPRSRIQAFFRTAGYPDSVATSLAGLCTNAVPDAVWLQHQSAIGNEKLVALKSLYCRPHLPQGAPTSPALANLCAHRLDCRLRGLAKSADAVYTRYADDLAFSGGEAFARRAENLSHHIAAILLEEGFRAHHRKTRIMRQGVRQHLAGLVVNQELNIARDDFDRLKAILTNCARLGPESQNREAHPDFRAHLNGRVGWVESVNKARGARLRRIFDQIHW